MPTNTIITSVFEPLGYQVTSQERGIYILRNRTNPSEPLAVALLLTSYPAKFPVLPVQLFLQPVPGDVTAETIAAHWGRLDARRFEESGLNAVPMELGAIDEADVSELTIERPEGGKRFAVTLPSGDVVCFN